MNEKYLSCSLKLAMNCRSVTHYRLRFDKSHLSHDWRSLGISTRSDTKLAVQSQKKTRRLKFKKKRDCTIREAKTGAEQLCSYCTADPRHFHIGKNPVFS